MTPTQEARDAAKLELLLRWLRNGHIPGAGYGTRIKLVKVCPMYGEETSLNNIEQLLDAALAVGTVSPVTPRSDEKDVLAGVPGSEGGAKG